MRTSVRLAHHRHDCDPTRTPNRLRDEFGEDVFLVLLRHGGDDVCERWLAGEEVLFGDLASEAVEVDILLLRSGLLRLFIVVYEGSCYIRASSYVSFWFLSPALTSALSRR